MNLLQYINIPVFIISFLFGLIAIYIYSKDKRKIYVYPTPENIDVVQYSDKSGTCFRFEQKEVSCPTDESKISKLPIQT